MQSSTKTLNDSSQLLDGTFRPFDIDKPKQPEIPYLLNLTAQVKHLAGKKAGL
ncbi:MAG: hypothetical protein ACOX6X_04750 [Dethiobacteria bacterium]